MTRILRLCLPALAIAMIVLAGLSMWVVLADYAPEEVTTPTTATLRLCWEAIHDGKVVIHTDQARLRQYHRSVVRFTRGQDNPLAPLAQSPAIPSMALWKRNALLCMTN